MSLCNTSKVLIKNMIEVIVDGEKQLELQRLQYLDYLINNQIDIHKAFAQITRDNNTINNANLSQYLDYHLIKYDNSQLEAFFKMQGSMYLDYQKFLNFILPSSPNALNKLNLQQNLQQVDPKSIQFLLQLLETELNLIRQISGFIQEIQQRWDCQDQQRLYNFLCGKGISSSVSDTNINKLLRQLQLKFNSDEMVCLLRRIDRDGDGDASKSDWDKIFNPMKHINDKSSARSSRQMSGQGQIRQAKQVSKQKIHTQPQKIQQKETQSNQYIQNLQRSSKQSKKPSSRSNSLKKKHNEQSDQLFINQQQFKQQFQQQLQQQNENLNPNRQSKSISISSISQQIQNRSSASNINTSKQIISSFYSLMKIISNQIEDQESIKNEVINTKIILKKKLSLKNDFTIQDIYLFLDSNSDGYISQNSFQKQINTLGLPLNITDIYFLWSYLGYKDYNKLSYNDIHQLFLPKTESYAQILSSRQMINKKIGENYQFSSETKQLLCEYIKFTIDSQKRINSIKRELNKKDVVIIFEYIDNDHDGAIFLDDFYELNRDNLNINLPLVFQRFDSDNQGCLTIDQLIESILI